MTVGHGDALILVKDNVSDGDGEIWLDSGCIWIIEPIGFTNWDVGIYVRERSQIWRQSRESRQKKIAGGTSLECGRE